MSIHTALAQILETSTGAFATLKGITSWSWLTLFSNVGTIIRATQEGLAALQVLAETADDILDDEEAQDELAEYLDEICRFDSTWMEMGDGPVFKMLVKTICATLKAKRNALGEASPKEAEA